MPGRRSVSALKSRPSPRMTCSISGATSMESSMGTRCAGKSLFWNQRRPLLSKGRIRMRGKFAAALFFPAILLTGEVQTMPVLAQGHTHGTSDTKHTEEGAHPSSDSAVVDMQITIGHGGYEVRKDG